MYTDDLNQFPRDHAVFVKSIETGGVELIGDSFGSFFGVVDGYAFGDTSSDWGFAEAFRVAGVGRV